MSSGIYAQGLSALSGTLDDWATYNRQQAAAATRLKAFDQSQPGAAPDPNAPAAVPSLPAPGTLASLSAPTPSTVSPADPTSGSQAQPLSSPQPSASPAGDGSLPSIAAVQGAPSGSSIGDMLTSTNAAYGLPPGYLTRTAGIESSWNANADNGTAKGPFQFTKGTAAQYGLSNPFDWQQSTLAAAQLSSDNANSLRQSLGRDPTAGELYLAHQQGAGGAAALLNNPTARAGDVVGDAAVRSNGGDPNMPAGLFASKWTSKFPSDVGAIGGAPMQMAGSPSPSPPAGGGGLGPGGIGGSPAPLRAPQPSPYGTLAGVAPGQGDPSSAPQLPTLAQAGNRYAMTNDTANPGDPDAFQSSTPLASGFPDLDGRKQTAPSSGQLAAGMQVPPSTARLAINAPPQASQQPQTPPGGGMAASSTGGPVPVDAQGNALNADGTPTALAYNAGTGMVGAPASRAIAAAAPPAPGVSPTAGAQPYGSAPLNLNGHMLTRQQAEDSDGLDLDGTDYDKAAATLGMAPGASGMAPAASAPSAAQPIGPGVSGSPAASLPAPIASAAQPVGSVPVGPRSTGVPADAIRTLLANPDTSADGLKLWQQSITGKDFGFVKADDGSFWSQDPRTGQMRQLTNAIAAPFSLSANEKRFGGTGALIASNPDDKPDTVDNQLATYFSKNPAALAAYAQAKSTADRGQSISISTGGDNQIESEYGKAVGGDIADTIKSAGLAPQGLAQIAQMRAAVAAAGSNLTTGPFAQGVLKAKEAVGGALGVQLPGTSEAEVVNNIGYGLASQAARAISSRPTQFEFANALAVKPGISVSPQGLQALLNIKEQDLRDQQNLAQLAMDPTNRKNWPAVKTAYYAAHPVMSPFDPSRPLGQPDVDMMNGAAGSGQPQPPTSGVPSIPQGGRVQVRSAADFNALPSGAKFIDPNGVPRVKP